MTKKLAQLKCTNVHEAVSRERYVISTRRSVTPCCHDAAAAAANTILAKCTTLICYHPIVAKALVLRHQFKCFVRKI